MAHLITGQGATDHINSEDLAALNAAIVGMGYYVSEAYGDAMAASLQTTNKVHISGGLGIMKGRQFIIAPSGEDLTIENGTQGMKRMDLIVARYEKKEKIESVTIAVKKGTPHATSPQPPSSVDGDTLIDGALIDEMPLYTISLDGLTVGNPVAVFNTIQTFREFNTSVSHTLNLLDVSAADASNPPSYVVRGGWIQLRGRIRSEGVTTRVCDLSSLVDPAELPPSGVNRNFACFAIGAYGPDSEREATVANLYMGSDGVLRCGLYANSCDLSGVVLPARA